MDTRLFDFLKSNKILTAPKYVDVMVGQCSRVEDIITQSGVIVNGAVQGHVTSCVFDSVNEVIVGRVPNNLKGSDKNCVAIYPEGIVTGNVIAHTVIVEGTVLGNIVCENLRIAEGAVVHGNIRTVNLECDAPSIYNIKKAQKLFS